MTIITTEQVAFDLQTGEADIAGMDTIIWEVQLDTKTGAVRIDDTDSDYVIMWPSKGVAAYRAALAWVAAFGQESK